MSTSPKAKATQALIDALNLARERVTADTLAVKQKKRDDIKAIVSAIYHYRDTGKDKPPAAAISQLLGETDSRAVRNALEEWES